MFDDGIFGGLFDLDGDGKLDLFEQGLEFMAISELMEERYQAEKNEKNPALFAGLVLLVIMVVLLLIYYAF